jgi:hypothetical protein
MCFNVNQALNVLYNAPNVKARYTCLQQFTCLVRNEFVWNDSAETGVVLCGVGRYCTEFSTQKRTGGTGTCS